MRCYLLVLRLRLFDKIIRKRNTKRKINSFQKMLQDLFYELDATFVAQIATFVGGLISIFTYLCPKISASIWGIKVKSQVAVWIVERIGFFDTLMVLLFRLICFHDIHYSDAFGIIFTIWTVDYLYSLLCFRFIQDSNSVMFKQMLWTNFGAAASISILYIFHSFWTNVLIKIVLICCISTGLFQVFLPKFGLYQSGFPSDQKGGCNEALIRILGGSLMQLGTFGLLVINGYKARNSLGLAMAMQLVQMCFSRYTASDEELKSGLSTTAATVWFLFYIKTIVPIWIYAGDD